MISDKPQQRQPAFLDIVREAHLAIGGSRKKSIRAVFGVAIGIWAAIATVGISASAERAVGAAFDRIEATKLTVVFPSNDTGFVDSLPGRAEVAGVSDIPGVVSWGLSSRSQERPMVAVNANEKAKRLSTINLLAASPEALRVEGIRITMGRAISQADADRNQSAVLLDEVAARRMGLDHRAAINSQISVNGYPFIVWGVFESSSDRLTGTIVVPYQATQGANPSVIFKSAEMWVETDLGAAHAVGDTIALAVAPRGPTVVKVLVPPRLDNLRKGVTDQTKALSAGLALFAVLLGSFGVHNTMLMNVAERRPEVGVRRALGIPGKAIALQFLLESSWLGCVGGLLGLFLGVNSTLLVCLSQGWLPVVSWWLLPCAIISGLTVGALAGFWPAFTASKIDPILVLRNLS